MQLPVATFDVYADPPWRYKNKHMVRGSVRTSGAETHYVTMSKQELQALPVQSIAKPDCLLFMWVSSPLLDEAIELGRAWGFQYKTVAFVWHKGASVVGHYTLSECELWLVFKRGRIPSPRGSRGEKQFLQELRRHHSAKPHAVRERIGRMFPTQDKIELFARERAEGWSGWGLGLGSN